MNYIYNKKTKNGILILLCLYASLAITSCSTHLQNAKEQSVERVENSENSSATKSETSVIPLITVKDAKIYAWWWEESVARAGFDGDHPPPKTRYVEIVKWEYGGGDRITTSPHQVDFISIVANNSNERFEGVVTFKLSIRFDDERLYSRDPVDGTVEFHNDVFEKIPWTDESVILDKKVIVEVGPETKLEVKEYDLTKFLNLIKGGNSICALRLVVQVTDLSGKNVASKETVMRVVMGI